MLIHLKLFAALREELELSAEDIELPHDIRTVGAARQYLAQRSAKWQRALSAERIRVALDQKLSHDAAALHEGAELAFFPPVTGG
jgi:molybdopterin synthase sulfur carrier subunit